MGYFLIFIFLLFPLLLIISICLYKFFIMLFQTPKGTDTVFGNLQLPPGSKGWPFVGEIFDYIHHVKNGAPEKFVEQRRKKYSNQVFITSLMGESMAVLCGAEGNKFLFSNENKLVRLWWPPIFDQLFPKSNNKPNTFETIRLRRMASSFLKPDALRKSIGFIDSEMKQHLISDWSCEKVIKVSSMAKKFTSGLSFKLFLSINHESKNTIDEFSELIEAIAAGLHSMTVNLPGTALNRGIKASRALIKGIEKIVKQRKIDIGREKSSSAVPQDVITHMLLNPDEDGHFLSEFDIASHLLLLFDGAYANLYNTITLVMMYLSDLPHVYEKVLKEQMEIVESKDPNNLLSWEDLSRMNYTWNVVFEVLRFFPPIGTFREAITDFEYAGYLIPKGFKMHWIARDMHGNPKYFPNPEKFDPTRFENNQVPYTFVPFGGGPRMCPGIEYARVVILVFIHNVVIKFKWKKLIPDEKLNHGTLSKPAHGFPIHLHPLKP